jgi:hypothetical protein
MRASHQKVPADQRAEAGLPFPIKHLRKDIRAARKFALGCYLRVMATVRLGMKYAGVCCGPGGVDASA